MVAMGTVRFAVVSDPRGMRHVYAAAADAIVGYSPADAVLQENTRRQAKLSQLFAGHGPAPTASTVLVATDRTGSELYGAAIIDSTPYDQIATSDPHRARSLAQMHRTLSALFVDEAYRGSGLGTHLLRELAARQALAAGARYLDGFVDDRNGSVEFYRRAGATVMAHNTGLPPRPPSNTHLQHVTYVNGHWFYLDLWPLFVGPQLLCSRCRGQLAYDPSDGGRLSCATCRPPPV